MNFLQFLFVTEVKIKKRKQLKNYWGTRGFIGSRDSKHNSQPFLIPWRCIFKTGFPFFHKVFLLFYNILLYSTRYSSLFHQVSLYSTRYSSLPTTQHSLSVTKSELFLLLFGTRLFIILLKLKIIIWSCSLSLMGY